MLATNPISKLRTVYYLLLFGFMLLAISVSASAQDVSVGTCRLDIPHFDNLDDAVHGVPAGGTIGVCPGTYAEQVNINVSLTLTGLQSGNSGLPVIVPPSTGLAQNATGFSIGGSFYRNAALAAQILVNPGVTVNISNITLDATNSKLTDCSPDPIGILYQDSSGVVDTVAARNQISPCTFPNGSPNPRGSAVLVQSNGVLPAVVTVQNSSLDNIGLNGLEADGAATSFTANNNTLVGPGNTTGNGIYLARATGSINNNTISNALHNGEATGYFGIIQECSVGFSADSNKISNSLVGLWIGNGATSGGGPFCGVATAGSTITNNTIFNSQSGNGIEVCGPNNTIQNNTINDSGVAGVSLDQGCGTQGNIVSNNSINRACAGVLQGPDNVGNLIDPSNTFINSKFLVLVGTSCQ